MIFDIFPGDSVLVASAIIIEDGKIFAAKRKSDQFPSDCWELPGDRVLSSTISKTIVWLLHEELKMKARVAKVLKPYHYHYDDGDYELITRPVVCDILSQTSQLDHYAIWAKALDSYADAGWFTPDESRKLQWSPVDLPILEDHFFHRNNG